MEETFSRTNIVEIEAAATAVAVTVSLPLDSLRSLDVENGTNANNMTHASESARQEVATARPAIAGCVPQRSRVSVSSQPASESRFSAARVKQRVTSDGMDTVAPASEPKRSYDGLYGSPAGRIGMDWDASIPSTRSNALASVANPTADALSTSHSSHAQKQSLATVSDSFANPAKVPSSQNFEKQPVAVDTGTAPLPCPCPSLIINSTDFVDSKLSRINQDCDNCMDDTTASAPTGRDSSASSSDLSGGAAQVPTTTSSASEFYRQQPSLRSRLKSCKLTYKSTPGNHAARLPIPPLTEVVTQRIARSARQTRVQADGICILDSNDDEDDDNEGGYAAVKQDDDRDSSASSSDLSGGAAQLPPTTSPASEFYRQQPWLRYSRLKSCKSTHKSTPENHDARPPLTEVAKLRIARSARKTPVPADGICILDRNDDDDLGYAAAKQYDDRKVAAVEKQPSVSTKWRSILKNEQVDRKVAAAEKQPSISSKTRSNLKDEQVVNLTLEDSSDDHGEKEKESTTSQDIQDELLGRDVSFKSSNGRTVASAATPTNVARAASAVPPAPATSPKRTPATTKSGPDKDNVELVVGQRVYARWPRNNQWYFGTVRNQYKGRRWAEFKYTIEFEDGDVAHLKRWDIVKEEALKQDPEFCYSSCDKVSGTKRKRISSEKDCNSKEKAANGRMNRLPVGMRVYARYPKNGQWYWGRITKVKGKGRNTKYDVKYDDDDEWKDLVMEDILSEAEYSNLLPSNAPRRHQKNASETERSGTEMSLQQLRSRACGKCSMCRKQDCGSCQGCVTNRNSARRLKAVCLLKMCLLINDDDKAQPLPWFPNVKFLFTDPRRLAAHLQKQETVHEKLDGFCLVSNGRRYRGIETYLQMLKMDPAEAAVYYKELFGIELSEKIDTHELLGKDYLHQWYDEALQPRAVYGVVTACCKVYGSTEGYVFTVEYEDRSRQLVNRSTVALDNEVPEVDCHVSERQAWAGCILADQRGLLPPRGLGSNLQVPQRYRWIPPDSISEELIEVEGHGRLPRRTLVVLGHMIVLQAKPSSIPGAGLGVWVSCWPVRPAYSTHQHLVLQAGDMIDIGVYAPLRVGDRKPDHLSLIKNFIHEWSCESYSFDVAPQFSHTGDILDITCDWTGTLHESARNCILPYANETDGVERPTIHAANDPSGAVHYLLGHSDSFLRLPLHGEEIEVKVDYGPSYEKVRVRKGYSRLSKADQKAFHKEIKDDDCDLVVDIGRFCASEVLDGINFIEYVWSYKGADTFPPKKRVRILLLLLLLRVRLLALVKESTGMDVSDDGDTSLSSERRQDELTRLLDADRRSKVVIQDVMNEWIDSESLRESLLEPEISRIVLMRIFSSTVRSWSARVLARNLSEL